MVKKIRRIEGARAVANLLVEMTLSTSAHLNLWNSPQMVNLGACADQKEVPRPSKSDAR